MPLTARCSFLKGYSDEPTTFFVPRLGKRAKNMVYTRKQPKNPSIYVRERTRLSRLRRCFNRLQLNTELVRRAKVVIARIVQKNFLPKDFYIL